MNTQNNTAYVLADQEAPKSRELLIEQAFDGIMQLTDEEKIFILSKYAERYGMPI